MKQAALADTEIELTAHDVLEQRALIWKPFDGKQTEYINFKGLEALYGGRAGPGKTECIVMDALENIWHPRYNGIIFRRTIEDLKKPDGPYERSKLYYPQMGGVLSGFTWRFPTGATISFGGLERKDSVRKYQSAQFQFIGFDELTHFEEFQYTYMFSRLREPFNNTGMVLKMRGATNPGGEGHFWVKDRFVLQDIKDKAGYYAFDENLNAMVRVTPDHPEAYERRFFEATRADNPALDKNYEKRLNNLTEVEREYLKGGNWDAEYKDVIFQNFTDKNISSEADYVNGYPVHWGVDDGSRHPRVILMIQERPILGITDALCVFDEYYAHNELHRTSIENVLELPYDEPDYEVHDPSATIWGNECWVTYGFMSIAGDNDVSEGIKTVRRLLGETSENAYLFIHPRCKELIRQLNQYRYDDKSKVTKGGDPRPIKEDDDGPDALRYYCHTMHKFKELL